MSSNYLLSVFVFVALVLPQCSPSDNLIDQLLNDQLSTYQYILDEPKSYGLQILYTQIDRDSLQQPQFITHAFNLQDSIYFYPASTVKMPTALAAIEKATRLGINWNANMLTDSVRFPQTKAHIDSNARDLMPSIKNYMRKIFLVSDNDAYNRLYEFCGQAYLNETLHKKGFTSSRIIHRLSAPEFDYLANQYTNPVIFIQDDSIIHSQPEVFSSFDNPDLQLRDQVVGNGYIDREGTLINQPFSFEKKNYVSLQDLQDILISVIFPDAVSNDLRWDIADSTYQEIRSAMGQYPALSDYPNYPDSMYPNYFCKFLVMGDGQFTDPTVYIFNKIGQAYGTLTDVAYIVDLDEGIEFFLAATIRVNSNGIYNDGMYEYEEIGLPFLADLGRAFLAYEKRQDKAILPDFSHLPLDQLRH